MASRGWIAVAARNATIRNRLEYPERPGVYQIERPEPHSGGIVLAGAC